jgi:hypothetical protein
LNRPSRWGLYQRNTPIVIISLALKNEKKKNHIVKRIISSDVKTLDITMENTTHSVIRDIFIPFSQALQTASSYSNLKIREGGMSDFNDIIILLNPYQTNLLSVTKVGKDTIVSTNRASDK